MPYTGRDEKPGWLMYCSTTVDVAGQPQVFSISFDVTPFMRAQEELRESDSKFRALFEYGASSPAIREQCSRFKSRLWQFFRDILTRVLKPEPAERVAMMMVMLIDGAIAAQQAESAECREIPPGVTAWSAAKALIYSEGGTL